MEECDCFCILSVLSTYSTKEDWLNSLHGSNRKMNKWKGLQFCNAVAFFHTFISPCFQDQFLGHLSVCAL